MRNQKISSCLWFDDQAEEAAHFYISAFDDARIIETTPYLVDTPSRKPVGSVMAVDFTVGGYHFTALNGGPHFTFTPAISFFVMCETENEVDRLWKKLSEGGTALMELDRYGWSEKYGWVEDRYGLNWQISLGKLDDVHGQKITPSLMYVSQQGIAEGAINYYAAVFEESDITGIRRYGSGEKQPEGAVEHAQFKLSGQVFMAMDSSPDHTDFHFNEAVSFVVSCKSQDEVDYYWEKLSAHPEHEQCGWLKDKYGVSWQIVPDILPDMMQGEDKDKARRVTEAVMQMKKLDVEKIRQTAGT